MRLKIIIVILAVTAVVDAPLDRRSAFQTAEDTMSMMQHLNDATRHRMGNSRKFLVDLVSAYARDNGVPVEFATNMVARESSWCHYTPRRYGRGIGKVLTSRKKAKGLLQLAPNTSVYFTNMDPDNLRDNIVIGMRIMRERLDKWGGDRELAAAEYNCGGKRLRDVVAGRTNLPAETRVFLKRLNLYDRERWDVWAREHRARKVSGTASNWRAQTRKKTP